MNDRWQYVISQTSFEFLTQCKTGKRQRIIAFLERLAANPYVRPHANRTDGTGRMISLLWFDGFEISYWLDHFVKEVRVLEINRA